MKSRLDWRGTFRNTLYAIATREIFEHAIYHVGVSRVRVSVFVNDLLTPSRPQETRKSRQRNTQRHSYQIGVPMKDLKAI